MTNNFEKSVKGGTKIKLAPPKSKYVEHILVATHAGESGVAEIFRLLQNRLRDSTWTIVFKSLIIVHLMIREGEANVTLKYLANSPSMLAIGGFSDAQVQGSNIRHYYTYLLARVKAYRDTKLDWIREGQGRLKRRGVGKGLLRETEIVQSQVSALLKCDLLNNEPENEITLMAFRLLIMDLLILFHVMNEGTINVLEHYFEMSKFDAERALNIYKTFSKQTSQVVEFLSTARSYEHATRLEIPKLKHAPTSLAGSLEEYLNDPDFEINRRQYLAQQKFKKDQKTTSNTNADSSSNSRGNPNRNSLPSQVNQGEKTAVPTPPAKEEPKAPAPDLIDFFESIEQYQQPTPTQPQHQSPLFQVEPQSFQPQTLPPQAQTGFTIQPQNPSHQNGPVQQHPMNPFINSNGNLLGQAQTQQPIQQFQQEGIAGSSISQSYLTQQSSLPSIQQLPNSDFSSQQYPPTNPFRQSVMQNHSGSNPSLASMSPQSYQPTNPFARTFQPQASQPSPFTSPPPQSQPPYSPSSFVTPPIQSSSTGGTNPFARAIPSAPPASPFPLASNMTTSTNPFRQSTFPTQHTGQGTIGGLEHLETVLVFPRPGQAQAQPQLQPQAQARLGQGWP